MMKYILLVLLLFISKSINAQPVVITWIAPTEYENNTPLPIEEINRFVLRCFNGRIKVIDKRNIKNTDTSITVELPNGLNKCKINTIAKNKKWSVVSNIVRIPIPQEPGMPPVILCK